MIAACLLAGAVAAQVPVFESRVDAVYVDVLATRGGALLPGLTATDFDVRDNGVKQSVTLVGRDSVGVHAVLALDVSGSVAGQRLDDLKAAALSFLSGLSEADRVTLLAFNHGERLVAGPAATPREAQDALERVTAAGGTALYDAALAALILADPAAGRPVVLIFSDGENRLSWITPQSMKDATRLSEAVVYGVGAGSLGGGRPFLSELADATGGRVWQARDAEELRAAFGQVLAELRGRYLLRYEPTGVEAPGWHKLEVKLRRGPGEVRARQGYLRR